VDAKRGYCAQENDETRELEGQRAVERRLSQDVGLRHVVDAIFAAGIPVVAHNCLHDMCKTFANFIAPLPVYDITTALHGRMPMIVDAKHQVTEAVVAPPWIGKILDTSQYNRCSALEVLGENIARACDREQKAPLKWRCYTNLEDDYDPLNGEFWGFHRLHADKSRYEAGYDALCTRRLFLHLKCAGRGKPVEPDELEELPTKHDRVAPLCNRICVASCGGSTTMKLSADDPDTDKVNIYKDCYDVIVVGGFGGNGEEGDFVPRDITYGGAAELVVGTPYEIVDNKTSVVGGDRPLMVLEKGEGIVAEAPGADVVLSTAR
jgi:hypothetical protein